MKVTQLFRDQLGLSQEMMAVYLAINKSQLSMYELGKRELPNTALTKLAELAVFLNQNKETEALPTEAQAEQELKLKTFLDSQIKDLEYKQLKEERLLEAMQKKHIQNEVLYKWAQHLEATNATLAVVLLEQATTGMKQNGLLNQTKQKMRLETITTQLDYCQSLKEK
jgi:transcriptional regulator with XRE-family HTH domain